MSTGTDRPPNSAPRSIAANSAMLAAAEITGKVATFALVFVAARQLPTSTFGTYAVSVSVALLLSAIPAWGFDQQLIQRGSADPSRLPALVGQAAALRGGLILVTFVAAGLVVASTGLLPIILFVPILAASLLDTMIDVGRSAAAARRDQRAVAVALAVQRIMTATAGIAVLIGTDGDLRTGGLGGAHLAGSLTGLAIVAAHLHRHGSPYRVRGTDWTDLGVTIRRSAQVGVENVLGMLLFRSDTPLIAALAGSVAAAHYAVTYRLVETTLFLSWTLVAATFPVVAANRTDPEVARTTVTRTLAVGATIYAGFAAVCLAAPATLVGIFGAQYRDSSAGILVALAFAPMGFFVLQLFASSLISLERYVDSMVITAAAFGANLGANLVLIPWLGALGAGITTTAAYGLGGFVAHQRARRLGKVAPSVSTVVPLVACALLAGMASRLVLGDGMLAIVASGVVFVAVWAGGALAGFPAMRVVADNLMEQIKRRTTARVDA